MLGLTRGAKSEEYSAPKTVLGFCAIVLGIVATSSVAAAAVLAARDSTRDWALAPLLFWAVFTIALVVAVFWVLLKDPTKLQLGQMTGREFIEYQRLTLGDSDEGAKIVSVPLAAIDRPAQIGQAAQGAGGSEVKSSEERP